TPSAAVATSAATASAPAPNANLLGSVLGLTGSVVQVVSQTVSNLLYPVVQRKEALPQSITVTKVIGVSGGSISIPEAGLTITFSAGAVQSAMPITVTADAGTAVSYEFGPHGTLFYAPVTVAQDMSMTTLADNPSAASSIRGGYTANGLADLLGGLLARVAEILDASTTLVKGSDGNLHLGTTSFIIKHFSGYILISA
ncbi:MAG: hypothetical protein ABI194_07200, partial [Gemmatimonadaceae bacterium]